MTTRTHYRAHFWWYRQEMWEDFDSAEEAQAFLRDGEDRGSCSAVGIVFPDGVEREYDYVQDRLLPAGRA